MDAIPEYATRAIMNDGEKTFNNAKFGSNLGGFIGGLFGDSGSPYESAMGPYKKFNEMAVKSQNPFYNSGVSATGNLQNWLSSMKDPSEFINMLMSKYQESPFANYQKKQAMRAGTNFASANGLSGSTPFAQQLQQNASNISSQDMQTWLQNVLGINTQYGAGNQYLSGQGANAANNLSSIYGNEATGLGNLSYGQNQAEGQDFWNAIGGGAGLISMFL